MKTTNDLNTVPIPGRRESGGTGPSERTNIIRLYGKNRRHPPHGDRSYWTDIPTLRNHRRMLTRREPEVVNVTSRSRDPEFRDLSPMRMGPVECYLESGRMVSAVSLEIAWQYSKVYSHVVDESGNLVDVRDRFITVDHQGRVRPSAEWFAWRDAAFTNPRFAHSHPQFELNKRLVRRAFPKGSRVGHWYWNGKLLDAVQARQKIYAALYERFVVRTKGFARLCEIVASGRDLFLYDMDGYDWIELGMTPAQCLQDLGHSFGHGMVIAFLLQHITPSRLLAPASN